MMQTPKSSSFSLVTIHLKRHTLSSNTDFCIFNSFFVITIQLYISHFSPSKTFQILCPALLFLASFTLIVVTCMCACVRVHLYIPKCIMTTCLVCISC